jgi:hypothetical protein
MPLHDWWLVRPGWFHHFHNAWIYQLAERLNAGVLPAGFYAAGEPIVTGRDPDLLVFESREVVAQSDLPSHAGAAAIAVADAPPQVAHISEADEPLYLRKQDRLAIRSVEGDQLVAIMEIISPGNKDSQFRWRSFLDKLVGAIEAGCHVLAVDLFPPGAFDPEGLHAAVWSELIGEDSPGLADDCRLLAAYCAAARPRAYVQPVRIGEALPPMPLFLDEGHYVNVPLETTYTHVWNALPAPWRRELAQPTSRK